MRTTEAPTWGAGWRRAAAGECLQPCRGVEVTECQVKGNEGCQYDKPAGQGQQEDAGLFATDHEQSDAVGFDPPLAWRASGCIRLHSDRNSFLLAFRVRENKLRRERGCVQSSGT
jgi:hypothetical protein